MGEKNIMQEQMSNEYPFQPQIISERENEETTIELLDVFHLFSKHLWKIVSCLILGMAVALLYTFFLACPRYQATAQVYVVPAKNSIDDVMTILSDLGSEDVLVSDVANTITSWQRLPSDASLMADYKEILLSRTTLQSVLQNLSLHDMDYEDLEKMITFEDAESAHIVKIAVTSADAQLSADIANELVEQAGSYFENIVEETPPKLIESAAADTSQDNSRYLRNILVGGLLAMILCCGFLLVRFLMNDSIATPDDVVQYFGVQPLANIPESNPGVFCGADLVKTDKWKKGKAI